MSLVRIEQRQKRIGRSVAGALVALITALGMVTPAGAQEPSGGVTPESPPPAGFRTRLVRQGTLSIGGQAQYGALLSRTGFGEDYKAGPGMLVAVRYRTGRQSAVGLSFAAERFNVDRSRPVAAEADWIRAITTTLEYYQYFNVRGRTPHYLLAGAGLAQMRRRLKNGELDFPGDAGVLALGGGTEFWWKRWLTVDVSVRYQGFVRNDHGSLGVSHGVQAAAGLHFYTSR